MTYDGRQTTRRCRIASLRQSERNIVYLNAGYQHSLVLSGSTEVGKTTLGLQIVQRIGAPYVSTRSSNSSSRPVKPPRRAVLQQAGTSIDDETDFRWIANELSKPEREFPGRSMVVDPARKPQQVLALRAQATLVPTHAHLEVGCDQRVRRHGLRSRDIGVGQECDVLVKDVSESYQSELARNSDIKLGSEMSDVSACRSATSRTSCPRAKTSAVPSRGTVRKRLAA